MDWIGRRRSLAVTRVCAVMCLLSRVSVCGCVCHSDLRSVGHVCCCGLSRVQCPLALHVNCVCEGA